MGGGAGVGGVGEGQRVDDEGAGGAAVALEGQGARGGGHRLTVDDEAPQPVEGLEELQVPLVEAVAEAVVVEGAGAAGIGVHVDAVGPEPVVRECSAGAARGP